MDYSILIAYVVGTIFGLVISSKWAFTQGVVMGTNATLRQLEKLGVLSENWEEDEELKKKVKELEEK